MLAAPLQPSILPDSRDLAQYRPVKDLEAFNALLPPPIEFVEGSSSGTLSVAEGKYQPINGNGNGSPKAAQSEAVVSRRNSLQGSEKPSSASQVAGSARSLYEKPLITTWPKTMKGGCGLYNTGNTCFLNSALQCLLHTTPLLHVLICHNNTTDPCAVKKGAFCMSCTMRSFMIDYFKASRPQVPYPITSKLHLIAKHLRKGRQEDSHEFLRYAIDAMQKSCLSGHPPKIDPKLAETTWVHKIFGGKLRSRVTCLSCGYNSDTFDSILDLSIDIYNLHTLRDALRKFTTVDHLRGADKYKCEKCKKPVAADKQFTVHEAPTVLTVHLKRFTPMGRKMAHPIRYEERLSLQPVMSQGQFGPTYSLYGIISHAGSGPNSGHYYAHVKDPENRWYEMNDESVSPHSGAPLGMKNAYILFYIRDRKQSLDAAVGAIAKPDNHYTPRSVVAGMKRKKIIESDDEDEDEVRPPPTPANGKFIGPLLPSPLAPAAGVKALAEPKPDPQAEKLKRKISEKQALTSTSPIKPSPALMSLNEYTDNSSDTEDVGEKVDRPGSEQQVPRKSSPSSPSQALDADSVPAKPIASSSKAGSSKVFAPIPAASFYGVPTKRKDKENEKKRKSPDEGESDNEHEKSVGRYVRTPIARSMHPRSDKGSTQEKKPLNFNPFSNIKGRNNLGNRYRGRGRPRGV